MSLLHASQPASVPMQEDSWHSVLQFVDMEFQGEPQEVGRAQEKPPSIAQVPTPPHSTDGSPVVDETDESTLVSISTTFFPGAQLNPAHPDVILLSTDGVFFYCHSHILMASSNNGFAGQLPRPTSPLISTTKDLDPFVSLNEHSTVINIILHAAYEMSCAHYSPAFPTLRTAVDRFPFYGISPKQRVTPSTPLFNLLLSYAPLIPLELYALAASHDLYDLAVSTSSHLLSLPLFSITDEISEKIGPVYLKRLFFLHFGRSDALKRVLLPPPQPHPPTPWCDLAEQKKLTRAWALASAYLAWDARPDLSTSTMESALRPLAEHLTCEHCQTALRERIKNLVVQWSVVKRTI